MAETIQVSLDGKVLSLRDAFRDQPINTSLVLCTALFDVFAEYFECFILFLLFASSLQRQRRRVPHSLASVLQCCCNIRDGTPDIRPGSNDWARGDGEQIECFFYRKGGDRALAALGAFAQDWKAWDVIFRNLGPDHLRYLVKAILEIIPSDDFKIIQYEAVKASTKTHPTAKLPGLYWRYDRSSTTKKPKEKHTGNKRRRTDERVIESPRESYSEAGPGDPSSLGQPTTLCISSAQVGIDNIAAIGDMDEWFPLLDHAASLGTVLEDGSLENTANMPSCPP